MARKRKRPHGSPVRRDNPAPAAPVARRRVPLPWAVFWLGVMMLAGIFLPRDWVLIWSEDHAPAFAQPAVLLGGFLATTVFLHAIVVLQLAARAAGDLAVQSAKATYEKALGRTGIGVLVATTLVFLQFDQVPNGPSVTGVLGDAATVGGIVGMLACIPHNAWVTFKTLRRLRTDRVPRWFTIHMTLAVIDTYLLYRFLVLITGL